MHARRFAAAALAWAALIASPALAAWTSDTAVNTPVSTAPNDQSPPVMIADGAGGAYLAWPDDRTTAGDFDMYAQHLDAEGNELWASGGIPVAIAAGNQTGPVMALDGQGGVVIVWMDPRNGLARDLYAQRFDSAGNAQWTARGVIVVATSGEQLAPAVVESPSGTIVVWEDRRSVTADIYAQLISPTGVHLWNGSGQPLTLVTGDQQSPCAVSDGAGGAIVAWQDNRAGDLDVYAQRVNAGVPLWTADGTPICNLAGAQSGIRAVTDGAGGAILIWSDKRAGVGATDIYGQRVLSNGVAAWGSSALLMGNGNSYAIASDLDYGAIVAWSTVASPQVYARRIDSGGGDWWPGGTLQIAPTAAGESSVALSSDGASGVLAAWVDLRNGAENDIYAQRVDAGGALRWGSAGRAVSTAANYQLAPQVVSDGSGGGLLSWQDGRLGNVANVLDIYAQRIEHNGLPGMPEPAIQSVSDVRPDQGGWVSVSWSACTAQPPLPSTFFVYRVWRASPETGAARPLRATTRDPDRAVREGLALIQPLAGESVAWEYAGVLPSVATPSYSLAVASTADSLPGFVPISRFMVEGYDLVGGRHFFSLADSGYSTDDIAPAMPTGLLATPQTGATQLDWNANAEPDLGFYRVYRGALPGFDPGPQNLVGEAYSNAFSDPVSAPHVYKVIAVDVHGNASVPAVVDPGNVAAPEAGVHPLSLAPPAPNPAQGETTLRWSMPRAAQVIVALYDASGRRVRTVASGPAETGEHVARMPIADEGGRRLAPGVYLLRLDLEGRFLSRRLVVLN